MKYVYKKNCEIEIGDKILKGDLNVLDMIDFDVILRMDWLSKHRALIIIEDKEGICSKHRL